MEIHLFVFLKYVSIHNVKITSNRCYIKILILIHQGANEFFTYINSFFLRVTYINSWIIHPCKINAFCIQAGKWIDHSVDLSYFYLALGWPLDGGSSTFHPISLPNKTKLKDNIANFIKRAKKDHTLRNWQ